jgi:putative ABC transport system permease protein
VTCITLIAFLPLALQILLDESEQLLRARAVETPLVIGAKGSALDLVMNSLYFDKEVPQLISMQAVQQLEATDLAIPIPLYNRFRARNYPVIGTTLDYFDFRQLSVKQGRMLAVLGECVVGADVARTLNLSPGDTIVSSPENLFDLAGIYPLKMKVVGVFERKHSMDDRGIFVDVKTTWVIQGLGHGHMDVTQTKDNSVILKKDDESVTANAKLMQYTEITKENLDTFHFHGESEQYPITTVIALPHNKKSGTLLRGRYIENKEFQITKPADVINGLMENIFRIKNVLDAVIILVGFTTLIAILLVFSLSLRLRKGEINTIFKLGCSRMTIVRLLAAEIIIVAIISGMICGILLITVNKYSQDLVRLMIVN